MSRAFGACNIIAFGSMIRNTGSQILSLNEFVALVSLIGFSRNSDATARLVTRYTRIARAPQERGARDAVDNGRHHGDTPGVAY